MGNEKTKGIINVYSDSIQQFKAKLKRYILKLEFSYTC